MLSVLLLSLAQDIVLPESVVTAPRASSAVTSSVAKVQRVSGEELRATGERSLPRAIAKAAGVWVQETSLGGGAPVIRGLLGNQILVVVDGVRLNDSTTRYGPNQSLNMIDPAFVERVDLIRGANSVIYGSDAIGGVISIWTRRQPAGSEDSIGAELGLTAVSASSGLRADATYSGSAAGFGWVLGGTQSDWGDLTIGGGEEQPFTGYESEGRFASLETALERDVNLRFVARRHRDFDVPRTDKLYAGFGQVQPKNEDYRYSLQDRSGYLMTYTDESAGGFAEVFQLRLSLHTYVEERDKQKTGSDTATFEQDDVRSLGVGGDWKLTAGGRHELTLGFDHFADRVDSFRVDTDTMTGVSTLRDGTFAPGAEYSSSGVFLQDELQDLGAWDVTLGARYSRYDFAFDEFGGGAHVEGDFDSFVASAEAARELGEGTRVVAVLSQGFRAPNLDALAQDGDWAGGTEVHNPDLQPEESVTAELVLEWSRERYDASLAAFATEIDGYIGRILTDAGDPGTTGDEEYLRINSGELLLTGLEYSARRYLGEGPFSLGVQAAYVRGRQYDENEASLDGVHARRIPPIFGRASLRYDSPDPAEKVGWSELSLVFAQEQDRLHPEDVSDPRIDPDGTDNWATLNLDVGGRLNEAFDWNVGLHNLLDERYRVHASGFDAPGFGLVFGLRGHF
ncbi:MAG: TonB-dependent receptor [Planctomycetes bacterium]|nr:TonB-dependent receptor [Planctomycetota bacterium]